VWQQKEASLKVEYSRISTTQDIKATAFTRNIFTQHHISWQMTLSC
jgi:hypothetical protein